MIGSDFLTRMAAINGGPTYSAFGVPSDVGPLTPVSTAQVQPSALPPIYKGGIAGSFQRMGDNIGNFLNSDAGRAALMRSAGATLNGGLGAGIEAGANYMDKRKATEAGAVQQQFDNSLATSKDALAHTAEQHNNDIATINAALNQFRAQEEARHNVAGEGLQGNQQRVQIYTHDNPSGDAALQSQTQQAVHAAPSGDAIVEQAGLNARNAAVSGDTKYKVDNDPKAAGIGSRRNTTIEVQNPGSSGGWFGSPTPKSKTTIQVLPLPKTQGEAIPGQVYDTAKGPARWDGHSFTPVQQ